MSDLDGWRVMVTRAEDQSDTLSAALRLLGADVVGVPLLTIEPVAEPDELRAELQYVAGQAGHVAMTSRNSARLCLDACPWVSVWMGCTVWCLGAATQAALPAVARTTPLPPRQSASALADLMVQSGVGEGSLVWAPIAEAAEDRLPRRLIDAGADVRITIAYRAALPPEAPSMVREALRERLDVVTLTSGSAARHLAMALDGEELPDNTIIACIGPATAQAATAAGFDVDVVAQSAGAQALADALRSHVAHRGS